MIDEKKEGRKQGEREGRKGGRDRGGMGGGAGEVGFLYSSLNEYLNIK